MSGDETKQLEPKILILANPYNDRKMPFPELGSQSGLVNNSCSSG
jgi:hypothetical protein